MAFLTGFLSKINPYNGSDLDIVELSQPIDGKDNLLDRSEAVVRSGVEEKLKRTIEPESSYTSTVYDSVIYGQLNSSSIGYRSNSQLINELQIGITNKRDLRVAIDSIKNFDYVETAIRDLSTDVLTKSYDRAQGPFFNLIIKNEKFKNKESDYRKDLEELKIYPILSDIIDELLLYGQYILKADYENNELDDSVDQINTIPAYSKGQIVKVFSTESRSTNQYDSLNKLNNINQNSDGILYSPDEFLIFTLFTTYYRTQVKSESGSYYTLKIPRGIIPLSIIPKINALKLLESLQPLIEVQAMDEKMFFYIRYPAGTPVPEAYKEARRYEKLLKSLLSIDSTGLDTVDSLLDRISTIKVIPLFGDQETVQSQSIQKINRIDLSQINDLRTAIGSALKIKINGDNSTNIEYFKLVKRIRLMISNSVKNFMLGYLKRKYTELEELTYSDFDIIVPDIYGIDDLDTVEYINMNSAAYNETLNLLSSTINTLTELSKSDFLDMPKLLEAYSEKLTKMIGTDVLKKLTEDELNKIKKSQEDSF